MSTKVWRDFNVSGGGCSLPGCTARGRFRYVEGDAACHPPWEAFSRVQPYCTLPHWRKAQPRRPGRREEPRGELHHFSKLKNAWVADIKRRIVSGESDSAIARAYGVTRQTIGYIRKGKVWKHVPWPASCQPPMQGAQ